MKALLLTGYNKLEYTEISDPQIRSDEVLIEIRACGICGSDVHGMDGSTGRRIPPLVMGHEASGIIRDTGDGVTGWKAGDRVTFDSTVYPLDDWYTLQGRYNLSDNREVLGVSPGNYRRYGAFAEYISVPQHILHKIPDNVSFVQAAMVEPVAVALHALAISDLKLGESCLIAGAGMIGLCLIQAATAAGASPVIALDISDQRLKLAIGMGAGTAINPLSADAAAIIPELTSGRGVDVAIEAVGIAATVNAAIDLTRKGGRVILVGNLSASVDFPLQKVVTREISLKGSCAIRGEYETALKLISSGKIKVDPLISAVAPLSEGAEWFMRLYNKEPGLNKVILVPDRCFGTEFQEETNKPDYPDK
jgi:2-desacetyl-2-hydroxyethyl bacteriochlorophyllide A dehydrogenase